MLLRNNGDFLRQRGAPPAPVAFPKDYFFLDGMVLFLFLLPAFGMLDFVKP